MLTDQDIDRIAERVADKLSARTDHRRGARLLSKSEAARLLGVDRSTVRRWAREGKLRESCGKITKASIEHAR